MRRNDYGAAGQFVVNLKKKRFNSIYKAISIVIKIVFFIKFPKRENIWFLHGTFLISNVNYKKNNIESYGFGACGIMANNTTSKFSAIFL